MNWSSFGFFFLFNIGVVIFLILFLKEKSCQTDLNNFCLFGKIRNCFFISLNSLHLIV